LLHTPLASFSGIQVKFERRRPKPETGSAVPCLEANQMEQGKGKGRPTQNTPYEKIEVRHIDLQ
jgi:hypothetical protein